jgi:hypothetical protein
MLRNLFRDSVIFVRGSVLKLKCSTRRSALRLAAASLALALTVGQATGADIRVLPGNFERGGMFEAYEPIEGRPLCDIELNGQILPGDFEQMREAFAGVIGTRWSAEVDSEPPYRPLCLNSPGGSLGEAIRIAQFVYDNSITTVLPPDSTCQSACSWIFMLGNAEGGEAGRPSRRMHYTARLSIHAPSIDFGSSETIRREPVERAFNQVIQGLGVVLAIANKVSIFDARPFIDSDFIEMAFSHIGEDWFEIDTVHKAGRWRIEVFGFDAPERLDERAAWDVCNNLTSIWLRPWSSVLERYGTSAQISRFYSGSAVSRRGQFYQVSGLDDGYVGHSCVVGEDGRFCGVNQSINLTGPASADGTCDMSDPGTVRYLTEWDGSSLSIYPGETVLRNLPRAADLVRARATASNQSVPLSCWLTSPTARVTNVNEYVNLRRQPDFSARVIRQVPLGEQVRPLRFDNLSVIGQERDRQSCINACQAFGANSDDRNARDRVQQCIDDNMLWYEITDARGNRGWVSRKFLEEVE